MARKNSQPSWWIGVALLVLGLMTFLNKLQMPFEIPGMPVTKPAPTEPDPQPGNPAPVFPADKLRLASFNIQVFGQSKLGDKVVINRLAEVIRQFDLVAIQEIRSADQSLMPNFMEIVNKDGSNYHYLIGPRLGRTISKEQYAYVYRSDRIEPIDGSMFTVDDPKDLLHREPTVASFRSRVGEGERFTFTLINCHTDPDEADFEVAQLAQVYKFVSTFHRKEDDIFLLGDLNVDADDLAPFNSIPTVASIVPAGPTNTRKTKQYDHILVNLSQTAEFTGRAGVFDMAEHFDISQEQAIDISDHQPVWAEFSTTEKPAPTHLASPPTGTVIR
ncbi:endonuclease/exonuclease/phosphatase family protein [Rubinisphaera brasiliensis]|uniref:Deoxyribonuclease I n=1 Tax=Rubinisphaera brasiliensis (strain ATCC 49424 / DSM 5305 / JCM 21570 / IAM 15109 / NBRC 103401 / IFAM 1448) TaxID=756272 RepID=F0SFA3_RUBBR|nr:endonuclease/exonuclease/phosphatase family protein [Rubinisphaera brasiliensis]ADY58258.1 Deoxyribonuclease I [Rubinisphaera brasiliensis DSM 5305]